MIDKLTPRYLETSKDVRLKEAHELIDALNVTVTGDSEGGQGVVKNIKGTLPVDMSLINNVMPDGINKTIGSVRDESLGVVYFFVYNSEGNHGVYAYSAKRNTYRLIFMDASLDFKENGFVKADVVRTKRRAQDQEFIVDTSVAPTDFEGEEDTEGPSVPDALLFTGNLCDYELLQTDSGLITIQSILDAWESVEIQLSFGEITEAEASYLFPDVLNLSLSSDIIHTIDNRVAATALLGPTGVANCFVGDVVDDDIAPDEPVVEEESSEDISVPVDAEPPALELLAFTGNLCDYPLLADADGNINAETILDAGTTVNQLITNGTLSPVDATHQFPYMTLNGVGFTPTDIGSVLNYLNNAGGVVFCENLVEPA